MARIKTRRNNKFWQRCREEGTPVHCWWECNLVQPLWKTVWRFLKKLKIELPYDPAVALLGIYPKDTNVVTRRGTCPSNVYSSNVYNSQTMGGAKTSINR